MSEDLRILVLGGGGFVGTHLHTALVTEFGKGARILNTTRNPQNSETLALDIRDTEAVRGLVRSERPTHTKQCDG